jgi:hypothetical protein
VKARDELLAAIDREQALIGRLGREREEALARVRSLQAQLGTPGEDVDCSVSPSPPSTAGEKVALFRSLFRGRDDVFPKLWVNPRTDRKGYAPACSNEWVRGVCEKPRVKCSECPNQAFISVSDQVVLDHLQGRHVMGVYPLLPDDACWFLAADFDEASWADDVAAFVETSRAVGLPSAVERSRSGNGAHVWFFFAAPVPAATARRMGCYLITETMLRRHQLAMASYDRFFPNQDTLPRGGFGLDVAMLQSLVRYGTVDDIVAAYGHVIIDECHHVPAASFERVLGEVKARYVTGLTATPYRRDGHQPIIHMQCGPVRFAIDPKSETARRPFEHRLICRETAFRAASLGPEAGIQELYAAIAADARRNELILNDVIGALEQGRSPILLTERKDHLEYFAARLQGFAIGYASEERPRESAQPQEESTVEYDEDVFPDFDTAP